MLTISSENEQIATWLIGINNFKGGFISHAVDKPVYTLPNAIKDSGNI